MRTRNAALLHFNADELARHAVFFLLEQRLTPDEISLIQLDKIGKPRLKRRNIGRELLPIKRESRLETQRIPST
ncbi:hypothetical protein D3C71_2209700 [compost metagenome]